MQGCSWGEMCDGERLAGIDRSCVCEKTDQLKAWMDKIAFVYGTTLCPWLEGRMHGVVSLNGGGRRALLR
jgi:hypothetical protein